GSGFAQNFNNDLANLTDPTEGIINIDLNGNSSQQAALSKQISDLQDSLSAQQQQLTTLFAQVNANLEAYPLLLQEVLSDLGSSGLSVSGATTTSTTPTNTTPATGTPTSF